MCYLCNMNVKCSHHYINEKSLTFIVINLKAGTAGTYKAFD